MKTPDGRRPPGSRAAGTGRPVAGRQTAAAHCSIYLHSMRVPCRCVAIPPGSAFNPAQVVHVIFHDSFIHVKKAGLNET